LHVIYANGQQKSVIYLIDHTNEKKGKIIKKITVNKRIDEIRQMAVKLYDIETDTSKLNSFIVIDLGNFSGENFCGEMIVNDSFHYYYNASYFMNKPVEKSKYPVWSDKIILQYLKSHRFTELKELADKEGKNLSEANYFSIGMYEKGRKSIYVCSIPAFITDK
jgi:hypothetical protein